MNILVYSRKKQLCKDLKKIFEQINAEEVLNQAVKIRCADTEETYEKYLSTARETSVIIIDIEAGTIEGLKELYSKCPEAMLVLYTESSEITYDMYDMYPLEILSGEPDTQNISRMFDKIKCRMKENDCKYIAVKTSKNISRIKKSEIYYIESDGHYLHIYTDEDRIIAINKLSDFVERLGRRFSQCHKSYAINLNKVRSFEYTHLTLMNGMTVQVSRRFKKKIKEMLMVEEEI